MRFPGAFAIDGAATREVLDSTSAAQRCEEEYNVLVENAARALQRLKLAALLPSRPLRWVVVEERGDELIEAWSDQSARSGHK